MSYSAICLALAGCAPVGDAPVGDADPIEKSSTDSAASSALDSSLEAPASSAIEVPQNLKQRIETAIELVRQRDLATNNAFWTVFHGCLAFGPGFTLRVPQSSERVPAFDYMLDGQFARGRIRGQRFIPTADGLDVGMGPTFVGQGHQDQFVAVLAQSNVPADHTVIVDGLGYSVLDFVGEIQAHSRLGTELSWTLIAIGHYLGTDVSWTNNDGEELSFEDLVRSEMDASIHQSACGGTHRLYGLTWAYHLHLRNGGQSDGIWREVEEKIEEHQQLAKKFQNPDGSFSTSYFRETGNDPDMQERINSSGHTLEWLATSLSPEELHEQWMQDAAAAVSLMFLEIQSLPMESGALYHATHGLVIYYNQVFGWTHFTD